MKTFTHFYLYINMSQTFMLDIEDMTGHQDYINSHFESPASQFRFTKALHMYMFNQNI